MTRKKNISQVLSQQRSFSPLNEGKKPTQTSPPSVSMQWESEEMWQITTLSFCE